MKRIRVLVVDDSAFMRRMISDILDSEPGIEVVGTARNGQEAVNILSRLAPDVITMDVEMPVMGGLDALEEIMKVRPTPVLMISSATQSGAEATLKALQRGAVDFIAKPSGSISLDIGKLEKEIRQKVKLAAGAVILRPEHASSPDKKKPQHGIGLSKATAPVLEPVKPITVTPVPIPRIGRTELNKLVVIGTSTGGPKALYEIIPALPKDFPAGVLIVQHMPPGFTLSLANRLNQASAITIKEAEDGDEVLPGVAYIAPGDYHMAVKTVERGAGRKQLMIEINQEPPVNGHRPSINVMFTSVAENYWSRIVAVLLTGMGSDGTEGMKLIKGLGGKTIVEDESTCVVFGIPRSAIEAKVVDRVAPLGQIANEIVRAVSERG